MVGAGSPIKVGRGLDNYQDYIYIFFFFFFFFWGGGGGGPYYHDSITGLKTLF